MLGTDNILVLAPHTDDGELGCGATISKYAGQGKKITYIAFSSCAQSLPEGLPAETLVNECREATTALGITDLRFFNYDVRTFGQHRQKILEDLFRLNRELHPQTVLLPAANDIHQDHQVIYAEGMRAFKNCNLAGYELPWNNTGFAPNFFEVIDEDLLNAKLSALDKYRSQSHRKYMQASFSRSLATVRGLQAGVELAEAFEVYRIIAP